MVLKPAIPSRQVHIEEKEREQDATLHEQTRFPVHNGRQKQKHDGNRYGDPTGPMESRPRIELPAAGVSKGWQTALLLPRRFLVGLELPGNGRLELLQSPLRV